MNKHYVLPVCFAVAAHGALLFGFSKNPRPLPPAKEKTRYIPFPIPLEPPPPVAVEPETRENAPKGMPDAPQPVRSAEPLTVDLSDRPTMTPPPISPVNVTDMNRIMDTPIGLATGTGNNPWGDVIGRGLLDNSPRTRFQASPVYPYEAKKAGMTGQVLVEFVVDEQGNVLEPRVVNSSDRVFEEASLRAVAKWRFEPGRRHGKIVRFRMAVPVVFSLNE